MCWDPEMEWMVVYEMLGAAATRQVPANNGPPHINLPATKQTFAACSNRATR
jgi:hypothetical protein